MRMMTPVLNRSMARFLSVGVFAAVVMTAAGCSQTQVVRSSPPSVSAVPAGVEMGWDPVVGPTEKASTLNIFGEFDGDRRGPARQIGEAGFQQHTYVDEGYDTDVAIDPTGTQMVFASTRHNEKSDLYLQRVDGLSVTQLTNDSADDAFPTFSPDGRSIAFSSTRTGSWQIYTMDADGRNVVQVTSGLMQAVHPSFSPDGRKLVYSAMGGRSAQWELWTVELGTGEKRMIGYGLFPSWSPDKSVSRIAFQRPRQRGGRWFSLWTMDLIDGEGRRVTEIAASTNAAIVSPSWSPEGKRLAFTTIVDPTRDGTKKAQQDVWTINADGSNRKRLTDGSGSNLTPFWAVDNRIYFVSDRGGQECVWSAKIENSSPAVANKPVQGSKDPFATTTE